MVRPSPATMTGKITIMPVSAFQLTRRAGDHAGDRDGRDDAILSLGLSLVH